MCTLYNITHFVRANKVKLAREAKKKWDKMRVHYRWSAPPSCRRLHEPYENWVQVKRFVHKATSKRQMGAWNSGSFYGITWHKTSPENICFRIHIMFLFLWISFPFHFLSSFETFWVHIPAKKLFLPTLALIFLRSAVELIIRKMAVLGNWFYLSVWDGVWKKKNSESSSSFLLSLALCSGRELNNGSRNECHKWLLGQIVRIMEGQEFAFF